MTKRNRQSKVRNLTLAALSILLISSAAKAEQLDSTGYFGIDTSVLLLAAGAPANFGVSAGLDLSRNFSLGLAYQNILGFGHAGHLVSRYYFLRGGLAPYASWGAGLVYVEEIEEEWNSPIVMGLVSAGLGAEFHLNRNIALNLGFSLHVTLPYPFPVPDCRAGITIRF